MKKIAVEFVIFSVLLIFHSQNADALCVKASKANLRSGPGTKYEKTWSVYQYMPFARLEKSGEWHKVKDLDGDVHWIYGKLVTDKYLCGVVKKDNTNIRTGPGTRYKTKSYSPIDKYYSFRVLKKKGGWVNIKDMDGDTGWVHGSLIWIQ
jgi:SH3-like domain-containing protein